MLHILHIENVAVIELCDIEFDSGLNILTGETGAGKSIVIDAIGMVLGERTSREIVRAGAGTARVSALFTGLSPALQSEFKEMGFACDDDGNLLLQRDIAADGRGKCRIGGLPATVALLRQVGERLINVHGQHDNQTLLSPDRHLLYLDGLGGYHTLLSDYKMAFDHFCTVRRSLASLNMDEAEKARRMDLLRYQIDELEAANITPGERVQLEASRTRAQHVEQILGAFSAARAALSGDEDTSGAAQLTESAASAIAGITRLYPDAEVLAGHLRSMAYELGDAITELRILLDVIESDPSDLDAIEARLDLLYRLSRKYGETEEDMLLFLTRCREELAQIEFSEQRTAQLQRELSAAQEAAETLAARLMEKRKETAVRFEHSVKTELCFLDMPHVQMQVHFEPCNLSAHGAETAEFYLSANPGEPMRPIAKIASGGELSRIMLAIQNVLADKDDVDTLIFDEVDTGLSGRAAQKVGLKLRQASESRQVICVTHSAQIAALARAHLLIAKEVRDGRTYTNVTPLDLMGRRHELARIMGGETMTPILLENAAEMLRMAGFEL